MKDNWISVTVRLSRKAYFPGAIVSGLLTVEPNSNESEGEYISYISIQVVFSIHLLISSYMVILVLFQT